MHPLSAARVQPTAFHYLFHFSLLNCTKRPELIAISDATAPAARVQRVGSAWRHRHEGLAEAQTRAAQQTHIFYFRVHQPTCSTPVQRGCLQFSSVITVNVCFWCFNYYSNDGIAYCSWFLDALTSLMHIQVHVH